MFNEPIADVAVLTVSFRNPDDVTACLAALSDATSQPNFAVFICENGGVQLYRQLLSALVDSSGPCENVDGHPIAGDMGRFLEARRLRLRRRPSSYVWVGCAAENLGYAGGINAWYQHLQHVAGWKGIWILNPDTEPDAGALAALVARAETGGKGMVGSTIVDVQSGETVRRRRGLHWHRLGARTVTIGLGESPRASHDVAMIEAAMDSPSGASMYVTRSCISQIGPMDETYFLFFEDLDWGVRAKTCGLGYASASIVVHRRGTTTGAANAPASVPPFAVYLEHRNGIHFVRKHFFWTLPIRIVFSCLDAVRFLVHRAPQNFGATLAGTVAGLRGEVGRPTKYLERSAEAPVEGE